MKKTYKTLDGAYARADKLGAKSFGHEYYGHSNRAHEIIGKTFPSASAKRFATHNLVKLDKTLYALECTKEGTYKWTAIGHFDHEGLLYPMSTPEHDKVIEPKPQPRKVGKGKGKGVGEVKTYIGKAEKKAIRSECYKLAKGNIAEYDRLCKERGIDNHR
jgi:hypothetical protein